MDANDNNMAGDPEKDQQTNNEIKQRKNLDLWYKTLKCSAIIAPAILVSILTVYFYKFHGPLSSEDSAWGTFGDFVGGTLNPIFSLLAFFALIYTIKLQSIEMRNSTNQLEKSANALDKQNRYWRTQNFESIFFNLIENYRIRSQNIKFEALVDGQTRNCTFQDIERQQIDFTNNKIYIPFSKKIAAMESADDTKEFLAPEVVKFFNTEANYFIPLAESLFLIINITQISNNSEATRKLYIPILKNQLTPPELILLFFYSLTQSTELCNLLQKIEIFKSLLITTRKPCALTQFREKLYPKSVSTNKNND